jgi:hypothetical protein
VEDRAGLIITVLALAGFPSGSVFAVVCGCEACRSAAVTFTPPAQFGAAEATCTCAGLSAAELKLDKRAELNPGDTTADRCGPNHVTEVASEFIFRQ